ncbi:MAG TPA: CpsB/CapC family capsule biosynthesis tyrosine phosphatase [Solirubrobacteraceae bacterium]|nr:CpsB/CapC family capsule biosynthesis tyrosine phosphatase [Solirubrobacteraceae bacterium]
MAGFVDIHSHLLPGIDDGPTGLPDSVRMAKAAAEAGIGTMAATPHLRSDFPEVHVEELAARCQGLREELAWAEVPLRVVSGAEVSLLWALDADDESLRLATYGQRGTDVLIETPHDVTGLERLIGSVLARGLRVTLGHPERSHALQGDPERIAALREQGVLIQINADALLARRRSPVRNLAERLCRDGLADVIASDGHRAASWRPVTVLPAAVAVAEGLVGPARAHWMASEAPEAIVEGRVLPAAPDIPATPRRWWQLR